MKHPWLALSCSMALSVPLTWAVAADAPALPDPAVPAHKAPTVLTTRPDSADAVELGDIYESQSGGVSFRPPASVRLIDNLNSKFIAEWADPQRDWTLKLSRMVLEKNTPLASTQNNLGKPVEGLLETTVRRLQGALPGGKVLRQDLTNIRDGGSFDLHHPEAKNNVGLIAIRYNEAGKRRLAQQAIIQFDDRLFYLLSFVTPGSNAADENGPEDPAERLAVDTFSEMLDSLRLLDRTAIKQDQDARLYRTRALLVNLTPARLQAGLIQGEQWVRIIKNGKDVGYSYITEEAADQIPRPLKAGELKNGVKEDDLIKHTGTGVLIGVRARMIVDGVRSNKTKGPIQSDSASWYFASGDRKHEDFSRITVTDDHVAAKKGFLSEAGSSDRRVIRMLDREAAQQHVRGSQDDPNQPPVSFHDEYTLNVTQNSGTGAAEPFDRKLPPWYVPQAVGHLLPRLLPLRQPKSYMFATYLSDAREVMMRYMDVLPEQDINFAGAHYRAVPINDRLGLEGSITVHYMSPEGSYIGSENKDQKIVMLPTNKTTLEHIWQDANLTRPEKPEAPAALGPPADTRQTAPITAPR
ncbi:MAG TPA: hypothetical protein VG269_19060 [Tepidisphaeraceae bacterium]|nr:hypothetical protein [Tepidisphaeraceae bacterium]